MEKCDSRIKAYKNGKSFDRCKEIAREMSSKLEEQITRNGAIGWDKILESAQHDELVYKLTLKYLRQNGYDIGNWKTPRVTRTIT